MATSGGGAGRAPALVATALAVTVPGVLLGLGVVDVGAHAFEAAVFGIAIVGAASVLSWAAEVAQLDIGAGLAIAVLALIAVLPEYAVDLVFAVKGGRAYAAAGFADCPGSAGTSSPCDLALANMTGSNRLLIGVGWALVVLLAVRRRRRDAPSADRSAREVRLERAHAVEVGFLGIATAFALTLPFKRTLTVVDTVVLVGIFLAYTVRIARAPAEEPDLVGPAAWLGGFRTGRRRAAVVGLLAVAAAVILLCAEGFAEALQRTGAEAGIPEFFLVQWLAPLASEAPELLVAVLYASRLDTDAAFGTLLSAKVNQWALLVGTLPLAFAVTSTSTRGLPLSDGQRAELLLTAAQSAFAVGVLSTLRISTRGAAAVFGLFAVQLVVGGALADDPAVHVVALRSFAAVYLVAAAALLVHRRRLLGPLLRDAVRTPYVEMQSGRDSVRMEPT